MRKLFLLIGSILLTVMGYQSLAQTPLMPRDSTITGPQTFAIVMGISKYKYVRPLNYADKDAELFRDYLQSPGGGSVKKENIFCLLNEKANNHNFWSKGFQWLKAKELRKGDRLFIYLAGHGDAIDEDQFFFLGYDCNPGGDKNNYLVSGAIQLFNLKKKIVTETTKGVEVFFIMDACRSDELPGGIPGQNFLNTAISEKKAGEIIMLATAAGQESLEDASIGTGHGLFTYYLVDGLNGMADSANSDNKVSFSEIQSYVTKNVPSIAQQRFNRKQDPYFCCNENSDKVISIVDTAFLKNWIKNRQPVKGPGNSFPGILPDNFRKDHADTSLVQAYDLFNKAVSANKFTGAASAGFYYDFMERKFPGTGHTLDAKTTLAAEFIGFAQDRINQYIGCAVDLSPAQKNQNTEAAARLERAINLLKDDEPEFTNSLLARMYFLKASGDYGNSATAFQYAYACMAIDKNAAYIQNKLAQLHLEHNRPDSALYYADKATKTAPNWACALTTLALVQKALGQNDPGKKNNNNPKPPKKNSFGVVAGSGASQLTPTFTERQTSNIVGINPKNIIEFDLGIIYQVSIGNKISIRPSTFISMEGGELIYEREPVVGGPIIEDPVKVKNTSVTFAVPIIIRLSDKNVAPYLLMGPSFSYMVSQDKSTADRVPLKKSSLMGDAGIGVDIGFAKSRLILSPEIKFTQGLNSIKDDAPGDYTTTLSSLKKRGFTFSLYLRGR